MNKEQEIKFLKTVIESWPEASYLKAPLQDLIPFVEREMSSDFEPDIIGAISHFQSELKTLKEQYSQLQKAFITLDNERSELERTIQQKKRLIASIKETARAIIDL